jgi:hypothetical protein
LRFLVAGSDRHLNILAGLPAVLKIVPEGALRLKKGHGEVVPVLGNLRQEFSQFLKVLLRLLEFILSGA